MNINEKGVSFVSVENGTLNEQKVISVSLGQNNNTGSGITGTKNIQPIYYTNSKTKMKISTNITIFIIIFIISILLFVTILGILIWILLK